MQHFIQKLVYSNRTLDEKVMLILLSLTLLSTLSMALQYAYRGALYTSMLSLFVSVGAMVLSYLFWHKKISIDWIGWILALGGLPFFVMGFIYTPSVIEASMYLFLYPFIVVLILPAWYAVTIIGTYVLLFLFTSNAHLSSASFTEFERLSIVLVMLFLSGFMGAYVFITRHSNELLLKTVRRRTQELERLNTKLQHEATTDHLTGCANRQMLFEVLGRELERFDRYEIPCSIILFDIDYFKKVNDTYGHKMGDKVLQSIASLTQNNLRALDLLARYGGEEFIIVMPNTTLDGAVIAAQKLRLAIQNATIIDSYTITASFGVASMLPNCTQERFIERADKKLYRAKNEGRNRVCYENMPSSEGA